MATIAELKVAIGADITDFNKKFAEVSKSIEKIGKKMSDIGRTMTVAVTAPLIAAAGFAIKMASDFEESLNKVNVAFKGSAEEVENFTKTTLTQFGISQGSALEMASLFGDMATGMGLVPDQAANMSSSLVGLAGDLASFKNIGIEQAQTALASIFTGETESLKGLGIVMTEANLASFALSEGITKNIKTMTQAEKVQLRYSFVMSQTANAQGDFARTNEGAANQTRIFTEGLKQLGEQFGAILLPLYTRVVNMMNQMVVWFSNLSDGNKKLILWIGALVAAIGPLLIALGFFISTIAPAMATAFTFMLGPIGLVIMAIGAIVAAIVIFQDEIFAAVESAKVFGNNFTSIFKEIPTIVMDALKAVPKAIIDTFKGLGKIITAIFKGDFKSLPGLLKEVGKNLIKTNPLGGAAIAIGKKLSSGMGDAYTKALPKDVKKSEPVVEKEFSKQGEAAGAAFAGGAIREAVQWWQKNELELKVFPKVEEIKIPTNVRPIKIPINTSDVTKSFKQVVDNFAGGVLNFFNGTKLGKSLVNAGKIMAASVGVALAASKDLIKGLGGAITSEMESFGGSFDALMNGDIVGAIVGVFGDFAKESKAFMKLMQSMNRVLQNTLTTFMPVFDKLVVAMTPLINVVSMVATMMSDTLMVALDAIIDPVVEILSLFTELIPTISGLVNAVSGALGTFLNLVAVALKPLIPVIIMVNDAITGIIAPLMSIVTVVTELLMPVLQMFSEIIGGAITTSLQIIAPILELIALSLKPLAPIFEFLAFTMMPIVVLFDLLGQAITWLLDKIGAFIGTGNGSDGLQIPALASGGIVNGPTVALIGEAGPEAVVPLSGNNGMMGGDVTFRIAGKDLIGVIQNNNSNSSRIG